MLSFPKVQHLRQLSPFYSLMAFCSLHPTQIYSFADDPHSLPCRHQHWSRPLYCQYIFKLRSRAHLLMGLKYSRHTQRSQNLSSFNSLKASFSSHLSFDSFTLGSTDSISLLGLFISSSLCWCSCSVPGVPSSHVIGCAKLKYDPQLNTAVTWGMELRLPNFPFLIGFRDKPSGWSTILY